MPFISSPHDEAQLYYVDYRPSTTIPPFKPAETRSTNLNGNTALFFIHGWPMSGRMYEHLMLQLCETHGVRCIATDRHGFGRSEWSGRKPTGDITYDVFAHDTLAILQSISDLESFIFVGASMGCGETILVYELMKQLNIEKQCKGFIWLGPSMPLPIKTENNPLMPPKEVWDSILDGFRSNRHDFVPQAIGGVFGTPFGIEMSSTALEFYINIINQADAVAIERCLMIITSYDFTDNLKRLKNVPILILHGDKDSGMPAEASAQVIQKLLPHAKVKIYENAAHGLYFTHSKRVIDDILYLLEETYRS